MIHYFLVRFPLAFIILSNLLAVIAIQTTLNEHRCDLTTIILTIVTTIALLHVRIMDDYKDYEHDIKHYPSRYIQQHPRALQVMMIIIQILMLGSCILIWIYGNLQALLWFMCGWLYNIIASKHFYFEHIIKHNFLLHNALNSAHLIFLIIMSYVWYVSMQSISLHQSLPGIIIFTGSVFLEVLRKIRHKHHAKTQDSYEEHRGLTGSVICIIILSLILYGSMMRYVNFTFTATMLRYTSIEGVVLIACITHAYYHTKTTQIICLSGGIIYYLIRLMLLSNII